MVIVSVRGIGVAVITSTSNMVANASTLTIQKPTNILGIAQAQRTSPTALGLLPPCFTAAGASQASTFHIVQGSVTATATNPTTVNLTGAAAFSSGSSYVAIIFQSGTGYFVASTSAGSFNFPSTNGVTYSYFCIGT